MSCFWQAAFVVITKSKAFLLMIYYVLNEQQLRLKNACSSPQDDALLLQESAL